MRNLSTRPMKGRRGAVRAKLAKKRKKKLLGEERVRSYVKGPEPPVRPI